MSITSRVISRSQHGTDASQITNNVPSAGPVTIIVEGVSAVKAGLFKLCTTNQRKMLVTQVYCTVTQFSNDIANAPNCTIGYTAPDYNDLTDGLGIDNPPVLGQTRSSTFDRAVVPIIPANTDLYMQILAGQQAVGASETLTITITGIYL